MNNPVIAWVVGIFLSVGGIGMVVKWALSEEAKAIDKAMDKILNNPKFRPVLLAWRPEIEQALKTLDEEIAKELDQASQEPK